MRWRRARGPRPLVAAVGALVVAAAVYGFTASNTVPASKAGDGAGTISGFAVSNVKYTLNATNPQNIDAVAFDLDSAPPPGSTIKVRLVSGGSDWYACSNTGASVSCTTTSPQATVASANELRVVVAQ